MGFDVSPRRDALALRGSIPLKLDLCLSGNTLQTNRMRRLPPSERGLFFPISPRTTMDGHSNRPSWGSAPSRRGLAPRHRAQAAPGHTQSRSRQARLLRCLAARARAQHAARQLGAVRALYHEALEFICAPLPAGNAQASCATPAQDPGRVIAAGELF